MIAALLVLFAALYGRHVRLRPAAPLRDRRRREPVGRARAHGPDLRRSRSSCSSCRRTTGSRTPCSRGMRCSRARSSARSSSRRRSRRLPLFVLFTSEVVALQALGTTFLLLVWLYVMANVIVFGAALELRHRVRRHRPQRRPETARLTLGREPDRRAPSPRGHDASAPASTVAQLRDRGRLAHGHEHRVEPEALAARGRRARSSPRASLGHDLLPAGPDRDDHADVARTPARWRRRGAASIRPTGSPAAQRAVWTPGLPSRASASIPDPRRPPTRPGRRALSRSVP